MVNHTLDDLMEQDIVKKVGSKYILWLEKSNRWIQLEEPAWFVHQLQRKGMDSETICRKCARRYQLDHQKVKQFVDHISTSISALNKPLQKTREEASEHLLSLNETIPPYSTRNYVIDDTYFRISFDSKLAEYYIHPPIAHLETVQSKDRVIQYSIHSNKRRPVFSEHNHTSLAFDDYMQLKKHLFIKMASSLYRKSKGDWLSFVHASAVTDGKQTILLSSPSGSGKSTMAALLQAKGLTVVSDDFLPIDASRKHAFAMPFGISVKEGSIGLLSSYYGGLQDKQFNRYEYSNSTVRYIPPVAESVHYFKSRPVKNIVFIQYTPQVDCEFHRIPQHEALKLFHQQAWVSDTPEHAREFIKWFLKVGCYRLEYGNTQEGMDAILHLFTRTIKGSRK